MKKKILGGIAVVAVAAVAMVNVNLSEKNNDLSAISLANVEALANEDEETGNGYRSTSNICVLNHVIYYKCTYDGRKIYSCTCPC